MFLHYVVSYWFPLFCVLISFIIFNLSHFWDSDLWYGIGFERYGNDNVLFTYGECSSRTLEGFLFFKALCC